MKKLLEVSPKNKRVAIWNSISRHSAIPPAGYFDPFCESVLASKDYQEVDLFLTLLEKKKWSTPAMIKKMVPLLQSEYSIINRRVYWFLMDQKLSDSQKQIVKSYYDKYSDFL